MPYRSREDALYTRIMDDIRERISTGRLAPGERLGGELHLCSEFGVSRGTLRQALGELESEGLLSRERGRGTFVRGASEPKGGGPEGFVALISDLASTYPDTTVLPRMVEGVKGVLRNEGLPIRMYDSGDRHDLTEALITRARGEGASGLMIFPPEESVSSPAIRKLLDQGFPVATFGRPYPATITDCAMVDNELGGLLAVEHLIGLGHSRIAFVSTSAMHNQSVAARHTGYLASLHEHGIEADPGNTMIGGDGTAILDRVGTPSGPTAVFVVNDATAITLIKAAGDRGIEIPGDLSIVGFDNVYFSSIYNIPLTTVEQPMALIGGASAHLLVDRVKGRADTTGPRWHFVRPLLKVRASSGPCPTP